MIERAIGGAIMFCLISSANAATVLFKNYKAPHDEQERTFYTIYLDGVKDGIIAFNAELQSDGQAPIFCLPPKLALTVQQAEDIMTRAAQKIDDPGRIPSQFCSARDLETRFPVTPKASSSHHRHRNDTR